MRLLPRRLNARIVLVVSCVLLATGASFAWVSARDQAEDQLAGMRRGSAILVSNLAETCARQLLVQDYAELETLLLGAAELPDILRLQLTEPDGTAIWDVRAVPGGKPRAQVGGGRLEPPATPEATMAIEKGRLVVWHPVTAGGLLGWLRAEYGLDAVRQAQARIWKTALLLAAAWALCSALLVVLVLRPTVQSIARLSDFSKQLHAHGGDQLHLSGGALELTELAASLNHASTNLAAAAQRMRGLNQELEKRVTERTAQLAAANQELEAFAYSVSHDLRAPLRQIDGFVGLLRQRAEASLDEQGRHYADTISQAARYMGTLVDDLLAFSRMSRSEMARTEVALGPLVQEVLRQLEPEMQGRAIDWHVAELPVVVGDASMLRMVFVNLVSNALKFTRKRERAAIELGWTPGRDAEAIVFVRDNGAGFDMRYVDKLFGVFQRLHRAEEFEGTGIGLASVRRIVSRHGGRAWAEGKVDGGATLYVSLPRPAAPGGQKPQAA